MQNQIEHPAARLAVEAVFNLLCVIRSTGSPGLRQVLARLKQRGLIYGRWEDLPRPSWWISLCQEAGLLGEGSRLETTIFVEDWLALPLAGQIQVLLESWIRLPAHPGRRRSRLGLLAQISADSWPESESAKEDLSTLQALGICTEQGLTRLGQMLYGGENQEVYGPAGLWQISGGILEIPYPPDWALLWKMENYLDLIQPGRYSLDLRLAAQRSQDLPNGPAGFIELMEQGLAAPLPAELRTRLGLQPLLRLLKGYVIEFTDADELVCLRRQGVVWRRLLREVLSRHAVFVDPLDAPKLFSLMKSRGLLDPEENRESKEDIPQETGGAAPALSKADRAYLLGLYLLNAQGGWYPAGPNGLLAKLSSGLSLDLRSAAVRRSQEALARLAPEKTWQMEEELPEAPSEELLRSLEQATVTQTAVDVLYQANTRSSAERRRLTPLYMEERRGRVYLIAFCHLRRARRMFRLDRMRLVPEDEL